jgi:hypothetical protein
LRQNGAVAHAALVGVVAFLDFTVSLSVTATLFGDLPIHAAASPGVALGTVRTRRSQ